MKKKIIKRLIIDSKENFLYIEVYLIPYEYDKTSKSSILLIQTENSIDMILFSQVLMPTFTIKQLIKEFKLNRNVLDIVHDFHYKNLLKFN